MLFLITETKLLIKFGFNSLSSFLQIMPTPILFGHQVLLGNEKKTMTPKKYHSHTKSRMTFTKQDSREKTNA